jgi:hypothetical protein
MGQVVVAVVAVAGVAVQDTLVPLVLVLSPSSSIQLLLILKLLPPRSYMSLWPPLLLKDGGQRKMEDGEDDMAKRTKDEPTQDSMFIGKKRDHNITTTYYNTHDYNNVKPLFYRP